MATPTNEQLLAAQRVWFQSEVSIDWARTFPGLALGSRRDPREVAEAIKKDVGKLKSCSEAGQRAIIEERCARAGVSPDGVPTFYIGRTKAS